MNAPANTPAYRGAMGAAAHGRKIRSFITPEGVDLKLEIASAGSRFVALMIDVILQVVILIAASILIGFLAIGSGESWVVIVWMLGFFLLRNFWFVMFELGPRAATPGKRLLGIRVVARDGGRLTVPSVLARNLVREAELFLPMTFVAGAEMQDLASTGMVVTGLLWTLAMSLFLLFNRDRMRLGDLIGGTWVVVARRRKMADDLTHSWQSPGEPDFSAEELAVYGVFELQELERVLRDYDPKTMQAVADAIRAKLGRPLAETDEVFLNAYYRQAKAKMERDLLFGKRRANKYEVG